MSFKANLSRKRRLTEMEAGQKRKLDAVDSTQPALDAALARAQQVELVLQRLVLFSKIIKLHFELHDLGLRAPPLIHLDLQLMAQSLALVLQLLIVMLIPLEGDHSALVNLRGLVALEGELVQTGLLGLSDVFQGVALLLHSGDECVELMHACVKRMRVVVGAHWKVNKTKKRRKRRSIAWIGGVLCAARGYILVFRHFKHRLQRRKDPPDQPNGGQCAVRWHLETGLCSGSRRALRIQDRAATRVRGVGPKGGR